MSAELSHEILNEMKEKILLDQTTTEQMTKEIKAETGRPSRRLLSLIFLTMLVLLDQLSKLAAERLLGIDDSITLIPGFLFFDKTYNRGAAFSFLAGQGWGIYLLAALSVIAGALLIYLMLRSRSNLGRYLYCMLAAGAIGNGIDRVLYGHVVDFIDVHFGSYIFPTFNLADCYLTVHCVLIAFLIIIKRYDPEKDLHLDSKEPRQA